MNLNLIIVLEFVNPRVILSMGKYYEEVQPNA